MFLFFLRSGVPDPHYRMSPPPLPPCCASACYAKHISCFVLHILLPQLRYINLNSHHLKFWICPSRHEYVSICKARNILNFAFVKGFLHLQFKCLELKCRVSLSSKCHNHLWDVLLDMILFLFLQQKYSYWYKNQLQLLYKPPCTNPFKFFITNSSCQTP